MTLSKQEMPSQNNLLMTEPTLHYGIEKKVMQLFASSSQSSSIEGKMDSTRTLSIKQDFARERARFLFITIFLIICFRRIRICCLLGSKYLHGCFCTPT